MEKGVPLRSWGRRLSPLQTLLPIYWRDEEWFRSAALPKRLALGAGRSYGDLCLNSKGILLPTRALNRFLNFDEDQGTLTCGAGLTIGEVLEVILPRGFTFQTCPNSTGITLGGAVAADAHGRNHFLHGSFGNQLEAFELVRVLEGPLLCSPTENAELFYSTIGGLGLTGVITWVKFRLKPIPSFFVEGEKMRCGSLAEGLDLLSQWTSRYEYVCLWWDLYAKQRGVITGANHAAPKKGDTLTPLHPRFSVPFSCPRQLMNRQTLQLFNRAYYHSQRETSFRTPLRNFLFTLDQIENWNRLFGSRGFLHFHFVLPRRSMNQLPQILDEMRNDGETPALCMIKLFGDVKALGPLSFPIPGIMVATDFKFCNSTIEAFRRWEKSIVNLGGRLYLAKDSVLTPEGFRASYPNWKNLAEMKDPHFSSDLWERVSL